MRTCLSNRFIARHLHTINSFLFITLFLSAIFILFPLESLRADTLSDLNQQINDKREEIEKLEIKMQALQNNIAKKRLEKASLQNQLVILDSEISKTEIEIEKTKTEIEKVNLEIKNTEEQIRLKQEKIQKQKKILGEIIRIIYQYDQVNPIEIILTYDSLSDFLNQTQYLETLEKKGKETLDKIRQIKKELEWQNQVLNTRKKTLSDLKIKLDDDKSRLAIEKQGKERLLKETEKEEEKYQELLEKAKAEQEATNREIEQVEKEIQRILSQSRSQDWQSFSGGIGKLSWPVYPSKGISAYFMDPNYFAVFGINHYAIDIPTPQGTKIRAPASGYMIRYRDAGYGYSYIVLYHGGNLTTVYGHVTTCFISEGQYVNQGDVIGLSGGMPGTRGAGWLTTGPHLHFEVRVGGTPVDPLKYLPKL